MLFINSEVDATVNKVAKFSYNKANRGGAFYNMAGTIRFPNTVKFTSNTATNGGGVFFSGGRIDFTGAVEFDGNKGGGEGGMALNDISDDANALYFNTEPTMSNNTGGTYNQTHKHCYVGSEKRENCCPSGTEFNTTTGACEVPITCTGGQVLQGGVCVCPADKPYWHEETQMCVNDPNWGKILKMGFGGATCYVMPAGTLAYYKNNHPPCAVPVHPSGGYAGDLNNCPSTASTYCASGWYGQSVGYQDLSCEVLLRCGF